MIEIITNPGEALLKAKQEKNLGFSFAVAGLAAAFIAAGFFLLYLSTFSSSTIATSSGAETFMVIIVFTFVIIAELLLGSLASIVMKILGAKGGFFEGITVIGYSLFVASIGYLVFGLFSFIPLIGALIAGAIVLFFFGIAFAIMYKGLKELFETDMITALVGVGVITTASILTFYFAFALFWLQFRNIFGSLISSMPYY